MGFGSGREERWKRILAFAFIFAMVVAGVPAEAGAKVSRLERVYAEKSLRICIEPAYFGISYRDPKTGRVVGLDADLARELARDLGVEPVFVDSSFTAVGNDLAQGNCDLAIFAAAPPRSDKIRFVPPHLRSDLYAVAAKGGINSWAEMDRKGAVVAVAKGTAQEALLRERLRNATLLVVDEPLPRAQDVELSRADVFVTDYPYSLRMLQTAGWARLVVPPGSTPPPYSWAVPAGDERWYARLEHFMREIKKDGRLLTAARRHRLESVVLFY